jgi:hypothetical protein
MLKLLKEINRGINFYKKIINIDWNKIIEKHIN